MSYRSDTQPQYYTSAIAPKSQNNTQKHSFQKKDTKKFLLQRQRENDLIDARFGFTRINDEDVDQVRTAWLLNRVPANCLENEEVLRSCVDYYFLGVVCFFF